MPREHKQTRLAWTSRRDRRFPSIRISPSDVRKFYLVGSRPYMFKIKTSDGHVETCYGRTSSHCERAYLNGAGYGNPYQHVAALPAIGDTRPCEILEVRLMDREQAYITVSG